MWSNTPAFASDNHRVGFGTMAIGEIRSHIAGCWGSLPVVSIAGCWGSMVVVPHRRLLG